MLHVGLDLLDRDVLVLEASIRMDRFAGSARACVGDPTLLRFADALAAYPLAEPAVLSAGHGPTDTTGQLACELVGMEVRQADAFGSLAAPVQLDDEYARLGAELRIGMPTTYERVRRFVGEVRRIVRDKAGEAVIAGASRTSASEA
jgi:hypothetical protein